MLEPGDWVIVFSDGVSEAFSAAGEEFGDARIAEVARAHYDHEPPVLLEALLSSVRTFATGAPQSDDVTALVVRYRGPLNSGGKPARRRGNHPRPQQRRERCERRRRARRARRLTPRCACLSRRVLWVSAVLAIVCGGFIWNLVFDLWLGQVERQYLWEQARDELGLGARVSLKGMMDQAVREAAWIASGMGAAGRRRHHRRGRLRISRRPAPLARIAGIPGDRRNQRHSTGGR